MDEGKQSSSGLEFKLHPLVLINMSDHCTRTKANSPPGEIRVIGCLLGSQSGRTVDISNSFEIKYEATQQGIVIDHAFLVHRQEQYKQVFPKLDVMGWYTTGEGLQDADLQVHKKIMEINESPVLLLFNPRIDHSRKDLPISLYETEFHMFEDGPSIAFVKSSYSVETSDAERIGVDQVAKILPSGKVSGAEQLTAHLVGMHSAIKMLHGRARVIQQLLQKMKAGEIPFNHSLVRKISSLVHSLPAMDTAKFKQDYLTEYNDTLLAIYLSTITKGVNTANEVVDKVMLAYDKSGRRKGGMF